MNYTLSHELSRVMLAELLLASKEDTRVWLRAEMDRLVDPLLDTLFNRLNNKLTNGLERTHSGDGDDCSPEDNHDDQLCPPPNQLHQSSFVTAQPSTSSHLMPPHQNVHYFYEQPNDNLIHCNDNSNQQSSLISLVQPTSNPNAEGNLGVLSNEQSNQNFDDDAGECYCDECLGAIEIDDEVEDDDDDSDSVQCIEDEQGEQELPVKRPRMDSTQSNNTQPEVCSQSPRQATSEAQPNQVTKQYITVHLQCPLSECPDTFTEDQLTQHMFDVHSMGHSNRCLVKDCGQAFDNQFILGKHIKQAHPQTTQLHCDKCPKHFFKYSTLSHHNIGNHQLGHFQCSFPTCTFTGEWRKKVYDHYRRHHKAKFICSQTDCNYSTYNEGTLKTHERAHLGIKPFRCKWSNCGYSSSYQYHVLSHIRTQHLAQLESANESVAHSADPKDYLEVASELL